MDNYNKKEMTLRDLIKVIFRHKIVILFSFVTITTSVYISLDLRVPSYTSGVRMLVTGTMQRDFEVARNLGPGNLIGTQMSLVTSRPIIVRTVEALKLYKRPLDHNLGNVSRLKKILMDNSINKEKRLVEEMHPQEREKYLFNRAVNALSSSISVYAEPETSIFNITVSTKNARDSGLIANVLSRSYVIFDLEQQIGALQLTYGKKNETIVKLEKYIEHMKEALDGRILSDIDALGPATVKIITQAGPGRKRPLRPSMASGLISAFIASMVLGITLAFGFDFFDMTFRSSGDVIKYLDLPYLGSIPKRKASDKLDDNIASTYNISIQNMAHKMYILMKEQNFKTLLLADAEESEETAVLVANIGTCLAHKSGYKVLIIDADLRATSLHEKLNVSNTQGLADIIEGDLSLVNVVHDLGSNLHFLPAGDTTLNPMILIESEGMSDIVKEAKELYEIVLVNCSDIKNFTDAVILSSCIDCVVFAVNEGRVRRQIVQNAIPPFKLKDIQILGIVLNNQKYVIPEIVYRLT